MLTYSIRHTTLYRYKAPVALGEHRVMFRPRASHDQTILSADLAISPAPLASAWREDAAGNIVDHVRFGFDRRATELSFTSRVTVETVPTPPPEERLLAHALHAPFSYGAEEMPDLSRFMERQGPDPEHAIDDWARRVMAEDPERRSWPFLTRLNAAIRRDFAYLRREEKGIQDPVRTLGTRKGSCRDFAVMMAEAVRSQGFAARFVSGYLRVRGGDAGSRLVGGSTHAWLQVYVPGPGWVDFDPTSGTVGNADLVRVAVVRDPAQATPLSGSFIGFPSDDLGMSVTVDVTLIETPERQRRAAEPIGPTRLYQTLA